LLLLLLITSAVQLIGHVTESMDRPFGFRARFLALKFLASKAARANQNPMLDVKIDTEFARSNFGRIYSKRSLHVLVCNLESLGAHRYHARTGKGQSYG